MNDVIAVLSESIGVGPGAACAGDGNVNCNGGLDADDALRIARFVANVPKTPPNGLPALARS